MVANREMAVVGHQRVLLAAEHDANIRRMIYRAQVHKSNKELK